MDLSHLAVACGIVPEDKTKDDVILSPVTVPQTTVR